MPTPPVPGPVRPSSAEINTQIRALAHGRVVWTPAARREWQRLTAEWRAAVAREQLAAAA